jgi:hypothetical protein
MPHDDTVVVIFVIIASVIIVPPRPTPLLSISTSAPLLIAECKIKCGSILGAAIASFAP